MVRVSVHQPNFLPWLRLLAKVTAGDVYVAYDSVQFTRSEFHARQRIKAGAGRTAWLTVPVVHAGRRQPLCEVAICEDEDWRSAHLAALDRHYRPAPHFAEVFALIEQVYRRRHRRLVDLNVDLIEAMCGYLGADVRIVRATALPHSGDRTERLVQLVSAVGGDTHLTSTVGTQHEYVDWSRFRRAGLTVLRQEFRHPVYPQLHDGFIPDLSAVDLLFSRGGDAAGLLRRAAQFRPHSAGGRPEAADAGPSPAAGSDGGPRDDGPDRAAGRRVRA
jgi:hypothetical protein